MKLSEFLAKNQIDRHGLVEYRLVDHADYAVWKQSEHFPGYAGEYRIQTKHLKITATDNTVQRISINIEGEENNELYDVSGFLFTCNDERVLLVFSEY
jgi:VCBS repeat-containing protein